jgi:hypothetical protein
MEAIERPEVDIAFKCKFSKARERTPDNQADFDPAVITLAGDRWTSERGGDIGPKRKTAAKDRALELLIEAIARTARSRRATRRSHRIRHALPRTCGVRHARWDAFREVQKMHSAWHGNAPRENSSAQRWGSGAPGSGSIRIVDTRQRTCTQHTPIGVCCVQIRLTRPAHVQCMCKRLCATCAPRQLARHAP